MPRLGHQYLTTTSKNSLSVQKFIHKLSPCRYENQIKIIIEFVAYYIYLPLTWRSPLRWLFFMCVEIHAFWLAVWNYLTNHKPWKQSHPRISICVVSFGFRGSNLIPRPERLHRSMMLILMVDCWESISSKIFLEKSKYVKIWLKTLSLQYQITCLILLISDKSKS